jgi:hypothetical protein
MKVTRTKQIYLLGLLLDLDGMVLASLSDKDKTDLPSGLVAGSGWYGVSFVLMMLLNVERQKILNTNCVGYESFGCSFLIL